ncbi:N-acylneuraminate cytidylyltransferase [Pedobacter sp. CAN_A7]|uniref:pseudaminic acid cytidylyltransferase n=1 Tax=Pedobacter sp. CAN_A7 TaxID=2787722 RepID=UPI0018CA6F64
MSKLAIIPARGGSKRIPRKNIKDFLGKPIIAYSIEAAISSGIFDEVMVSTDDEEIAEIARAYGASVPFIRSIHNADDHATTIAVLKEVELEYQKRFRMSYEAICCIYPTAPLLNSQSLIEGYKLLIEKELDTVFPVTAFSYPIWRALEIQDGRTQMIWPEHQSSRSQDFKAAYHDAGQWYWYKPRLITGSLFTNNTGSIVLPEEEVQDIDCLSDWVLAELKYKLKTT